MRSVIERITERGLGSEIRTIVGGAPLTGDFADRIGADGYSPDAPGAVGEVKRLLA